ncbi:hypothetical protein B0I35DRAFT_73235 [Stachybotrys elegans]|uniref:Uncharacterized protein n=1 Tax=Stachybotrys elegans TaxID=80388 RepID=A0A8K0SEU9_9HYPO|nr:hypothetical protein B0I35DRAFT_73235 [Stachybotrys elegans]
MTPDAHPSRPLAPQHFLWPLFLLCNLPSPMCSLITPGAISLQYIQQACPPHGMSRKKRAAKQRSPWRRLHHWTKLPLGAIRSSSSPSATLNHPFRPPGIYSLYHNIPFPSSPLHSHSPILLSLHLPDPSLFAVS